jgi:6-phosphogluconate dehydrogenase
VYCQWNATELNSYLLEITKDIFCKSDDQTGKRLIDVILDEAAQKGTGRWTSQDAMDIETPIPTIDISVSMRELSAMKAEREKASRKIKGPENKRFLNRLAKEREFFLERLRKGLYAAMLITFAQGFAQLRKASQRYGYGIEMEKVARIWRGGCIIRAALLEDIRAACRENPDLENLLMNDRLGDLASTLQYDLRYVIETSVALGIPAPAFMVSLAYFDSYRSEWMPANLIQAQRDYFGAHTYERIDARGTFHTEWKP